MDWNVGDSMTVYISSTSCTDQTMAGLLEFVSDGHFEGLEMSAGPFITCLNEGLDQLAEKTELAFHNYFPVPKIPFVLNLASQDDEIYHLSLELVKRGIEFAESFGTGVHSFHAGFLLDPTPDYWKEKRSSEVMVCVGLLGP